MPAEQAPELTDREHELIMFVAHGLSRRQIATLLHTSFFTVKTQIERLYVKIDARNMGDAVRLGYMLKLLRPCGKFCAGCAARNKNEKDSDNEH